MDDKTVLGIHSWVDPNTEGSFDRFVDGHSWISVTRNGHTEYYGLWPDDHGMIERRGLSNGPGSDIRTGLEAGRQATQSRYYDLSAEQATKLEGELKQNVAWGYTHTCASWASEVTGRVTGENIDATEYGVFETPRELVDHLKELERSHPTAPGKPIEPGQIPEAGSSSWSDEAPRLDQVGHPYHALYTRIRDQLPETVSDDQAAYAVLAAKNAGIDHVDKLDRAVLHEGHIFVVGKTPGYLAKVDPSEPTPPLKHTGEALAQERSMDPATPTQSPGMTR